MNPHHSSYTTYIDLPCQSEDAFDPLEEFLSQLLSDFPNVPSISTPACSSTCTFSYEETSSVPDPAPLHTCHWVTRANPPLICGALLPSDPKHACEHFRVVHSVRGNDKATVECLWYGCRSLPMQRGSLIRHLLAVHLKLLRWQCEACGRVFSRRGSGHVCVRRASTT